MVKTKLLSKIKMEDWNIFHLVAPLPSILQILNSIPTKFIMVVCAYNPSTMEVGERGYGINQSYLWLTQSAVFTLPVRKPSWRTSPRSEQRRSWKNLT